MAIINYRTELLACNKMQNSCFDECSQHLKRKMVKTTEVAFIIVLAMAIEGIRNNANEKVNFERNKVQERSMLDQMKYEYCVKIITVCYLLWDSPPDYDDGESLSADNAMDIHNRFVTDLIDEEIRKARCLPNKQTDKELKSYWENVRRWQREVEKQFLSADIFIVKEELDGGRAIKINLWNVFKIQMLVICNRTKGPDDSSIESITSLQNFNTSALKVGQFSCGANREIGMWINEQINVGQIIEDIANKFSSILAKIEMQLNKNCCPYAVLRDRIDVINDNIDTIMQLKALDQYDRAESTGYAWLDLQNLLVRLDYLNQQTIKGKQSSNCCIDWEANVKAVKNRLQSDKNLLQSVSSTNFTPKQISTFLNKFNHNFEHIQNRLLATEKLYDQPVTENITNDCCSSHSLLGSIGELINDLKLSKLKHHSSKDLLDDVIRTNSNINNSQILFDMDQNQTNRMITKCSSICALNPKKENSIYSNFTHLVDQLQVITSNMKSKSAAYSKVDWIYLNKTVTDGYNKLANMDEQLNQMLKKRYQNHSQENNKIPNVKRYFDINEDKDLKHCLNTIDQKSNDVQELVRMLSENMQFHRNTKANKETAIKDLYENVKKLLKTRTGIKLEQTLQLASNQSYKGEQKDSMKNIEHRIQEISRILDEKSQTIYEQSQLINEFKTNLAKNFTDEMRGIKEIKAVDTETSEKIETRIDELERKLNATKLRGLKNLIDNPLTSNKLDYLEARLNSMTNQSRISVKHLLGTIDELEARLKTIKDDINKSYENAKKCSNECDWGELPSIEELQGRLKALEANLNKTSKSTLVKSVRGR